MQPTRICGSLVTAANLICLAVLSVGVATGPAFAQGRSDSAPGQTKEKPAKNTADLERKLVACVSKRHRVACDGHRVD